MSNSEYTFPGTGPPTRDELRLHYPPKFSWFQLKLFVNSGDLGLLKRDKMLQKRYMAWADEIKVKYGSIVNYLTEYRLQWGKPDKLSLLPSAIVDAEDALDLTPASSSIIDGKEALASDVPGYFTVDTPRKLVSIIQNDWPYSVPLDIEHSLVWTRVPIFPSPYLFPQHIADSLSEELRNRVTKRLEQDGIWGFTGSRELPPSPSLLPEYLGALTEEWGITMDKLIRSPKGTPEEEKVIALASEEVDNFVKRRWNEADWETAWFVNPPRLQSVKGLAHAHVFARKKSDEEVDIWDSCCRSTSDGNTNGSG